jgi:hypothetical protein
MEAKVEVMTVTELLRRLGRKTEDVNMLEVEAYLRSSKVLVFSLPRKRFLILGLTRLLEKSVVTLIS